MSSSAPCTSQENEDDSMSSPGRLQDNPLSCAQDLSIRSSGKGTSSSMDQSSKKSGTTEKWKKLTPKRSLEIFQFLRSVLKKPAKYGASEENGGAIDMAIWKEELLTELRNLKGRHVGKPPISNSDLNRWLRHATFAKLMGALTWGKFRPSTIGTSTLTRGPQQSESSSRSSMLPHSSTTVINNGPTLPGSQNLDSERRGTSVVFDPATGGSDEDVGNSANNVTGQNEEIPTDPQQRRRLEPEIIQFFQGVQDDLESMKCRYRQMLETTGRYHASMDVFAQQLNLFTVFTHYYMNPNIEPQFYQNN